MNRTIRTKMKVRALFLLAVLIGGSYTLFQSFEEYNEKEFTQFISLMNSPFNTLIFTKPSISGTNAETWIVNDDHEIDELLHFLKNYTVRKLKPDEINTNDDIEQFSISLKDDDDNLITIIVTENLIIQNQLLYYEIVDGPLDVDWLVHFFVHNQGKL